jgi:chromosome segregation ATPase
MTRDEIKAILPNITKEELDKIMDINGSDIEKAKGDVTALNTQITDLSNQITDRDNQLKELKSTATNNADLTKKIEELETANKTAKSNYEKTIADMKRDNAINNSIRDAKAKNVKAVRALLDLDKIKMDGDTVLGLKDQIDALAKSDAYLFEVEDATKGGVGGGFVPGVGSKGNDNDTNASFTDAISTSLAKLGIVK